MIGIHGTAGWYLAAGVPLLVSIGVAQAAPLLLRRLRPALAARLLVALGLVAALGTGVSLLAVAGLGVAQFPGAARVAHWSADAISDATPVPMGLWIATAAGAAALGAAALIRATRTTMALRRAIAAGRGLAADAAGLVVLTDSEHIDAYAVPGAPWRLNRRPGSGRVVVTTGLLMLLDEDERHAVLAHEWAHLRHAHAGYVQLAELARAADPLLGTIAAVVRQAVEAWADQDAVAEVGDPLCVAQALAKVGLHRRAAASATGPGAPATLAAAETDVAARVRALLDPLSARSARRAGAVATATAILAVALCLLGAVTLAVRVHADVGTARTQWHVATPQR